LEESLYLLSCNLLSLPGVYVVNNLGANDFEFICSCLSRLLVE